jgi:hypothetical protein
LLFRISAVILILFASLHTFGMLTFQPPTAEAQAVFDSMNNVRFQVDGSTFSYGNFYRGLGLALTFYLAFLAILAWHLGTLARVNPKAIGPVGWSLCGLNLCVAALSFIYIAAPPAILSLVLAAAFGWASARV